jgi:signal transduction histidine kinase/ligand-binding sensor domain-containing protein
MISYSIGKLKRSGILLLMISFFILGYERLYCQVEYRFEHISKSDGLSQGTINDVFEDSNGLMWFGTNDGLNRYDGKQILVYRRNHVVPNSLPNNNILSINQDKDDRLWVGTMGNGLCFLDPIKNTFHNYHVLVNDTNTIDIGENVYGLSYDKLNNILWAGSNKGVIRIDLDIHSLSFFDFTTTKFDSIYAGNVYSILAQDSIVWIGTDKAGLIRYDIHDSSFVSIPIEGDRPFMEDKQNRGTIIRIATLKTGQIWVASYGDFMLYYDKEKEVLKNILPPDDQINNSTAYFTRGIGLVGDTAIWCSTTGAGVFIYNLKSKQFNVIHANQNNPYSISSNSIKTIYPDKNGGVWLGDNGHGLNYYYPVNKNIKHLSPSAKGSSGLTFKSVRKIYRDENSILWIGGYGGLNAFDKNYQRVIVNHEIPNAYYIHPDPVEKSILWIGIEGGGLNKIRKADGILLQTIPTIGIKSNRGIYGNSVYSIQDKNQDELWVGTESGLNAFNKKDGSSEVVLHDPFNKFSIPAGRIRVIFTDSKKRTWIGTLGGGLAYMNDNSYIFNNFKHNQDDHNSISSNIIYSVFESKEGMLFIGTDNGLNIFNEKTYDFKKISTADGLVNDVVYGILEDLNADLWLSTNEGISCYNPISNTFRNYDHEDGLQANEFNSGAYYQDNDGNLYFGGVNGVSIFQPTDLRNNYLEPKIVFTRLEIANETAITDPPITKAREINLNYYNQSFSLEFAALNFYKPKKNQYAYRIKEIQDKWINLGNQNNIEIANLGYGNFTIEVIGSNNDGIWNYEGASLKIIIPPPYWAQLWFKILASIFVVVIIASAFFLRIRNLANKRKKLQLEIDLRTKELKEANEQLKSEIETRQKTEIQLLSANQTKDRFFSIIAHDLKSPFNALLGLTEVLNNEYESFNEDEIKELIFVLRKSIEDLYNLLENLLSWSISQRGLLVMQKEDINFSELLTEVFQLLSNQAKQKSIRLISEVISSANVYSDKSSLSTIMRNMVSNAIKYTPQGGEITVSTFEDDLSFSISISDTGVGMAPEIVKKLFRIDENIQTKGTANEKGTGLGLVLCYEFVSANGGSIDVESQLGKGTTFTVRLPKKILT